MQSLSQCIFSQYDTVQAEKAAALIISLNRYELGFVIFHGSAQNDFVAVLYT